MKLSIPSTCHRLAVEPWSYLQDVLRRLQTLGPGQLDQLLPERWQAAQRAKQATGPPATPDPNVPAVTGLAGQTLKKRNPNP